MTKNFLSGVGIGSFANVGRNFSGPATNGPNLYLALEIGELCNLSCRHCVYHKSLQGPHPDRHIVEYVASLLAQGRLNPMWLSLAGKEPALFPDETIRVLQAARMGTQARTILMTNALMLNNDSLRQRLRGLVDLVDVSIDGNKQYHEWMRGKGTFAKTFTAVQKLEAEGFFVSIIATAVNASGQIQSIVDLAKRLNREKIKAPLSISLYYGSPGDPLRLKAETISNLVSKLAKIPHESRVLYTAHYACEFAEVKDRLNINGNPTIEDPETAIPVLRFGDHLRILLFQETRIPQYGIRVSNDGLVYLGCNHLTLGKAASKFAVGKHAELEAICQELQNNDIQSPKLRSYLETELPLGCSNCAALSVCRGGDKQSGIYHTGKAADPYCGLLNPPTSYTAELLPTLAQRTYSRKGRRNGYPNS